MYSTKRSQDLQKAWSSWWISENRGWAPASSSFLSRNNKPNDQKSCRLYSYTDCSCYSKQNQVHLIRPTSFQNLHNLTLKRTRIDKTIPSNSYSGFVKMSLKLGLSNSRIYSTWEDTFLCILPPSNSWCAGRITKVNEKCHGSEKKENTCNVNRGIFLILSHYIDSSKS